jgi:hypothetical protein
LWLGGRPRGRRDSAVVQCSLRTIAMHPTEAAMNVRTLLTRKGLVAGALAVLMMGTGSSVVAAGSSSPSTQGPAIHADAAKLEQARILFELNSSGKDIGVQVLLDGEPWKSVRVYNPSGKQLLGIQAHGNLRQLGLTEEFLESHEPELAEIPVRQFVKLFPKGRYTVVARSTEGQTMIGRAKLSHRIPRAPKVVAPHKGDVTDPGHTVIRWKPVTKPAGIKIRGYQVIVELQDPNTGDAIRTFSVDLPRGATRVTVPRQFLKSDTGFAFEVLAVAKNRNQTITEGEFTTAR